ncbi:MAG: hypothetical protein ACK5R2_14400 [Cyanobacteriota bacterium]|jgi:hypothetical protein
MDLPGIRKRIPRRGGRVFSKAFEKHVENGEDVIGLIAYSFYKKAKVDWLRAFNKRTGEDPSETQIHEWACDHLTDENIREYRNRAFRLVEIYRKQEIMKANLGQVESTHEKVERICHVADSIHKKVESLTGNKGFWANVMTNQAAFLCTTALAGLVYIGLHIGGLEPLKWFSDKAPGSSEIRPGNLD